MDREGDCEMPDREGVHLECERRLTTLEASSSHHQEEVIDLKHIIAKLDSALEKLLGNGWSTKIEKLGVKFEEIARLMTERLAVVEAQNTAVHRRMDAFEASANAAVLRFERGLEHEADRRRGEDNDLRSKWRWLVVLQVTQLLTLIGTLLGMAYWVSASLHGIMEHLAQ